MVALIAAAVALAGLDGIAEDIEGIEGMTVPGFGTAAGGADGVFCGGWAGATGVTLLTTGGVGKGGAGVGWGCAGGTDGVGLGMPFPRPLVWPLLPNVIPIPRPRGTAIVLAMLMQTR